MTLVAHSSLLRVICGPDVLLCSANADACVSWYTKEQGWDVAPETVALVRTSLIKIIFWLCSSLSLQYVNS